MNSHGAFVHGHAEIAGFDFGPMPDGNGIVPLTSVDYNFFGLDS